MNVELLKKLTTQAREMSRRVEIPFEKALEILKKGRAKRNPGKADDEGAFEQKVRAAIDAGLEPQKAFRQVLREHPEEAKAYFAKVAAGGKDSLEGVIK